MRDLIEFLLARIGEDEAAARAAIAGPWCHGIRRKGEPGHWRGVDGYSVLADRTRFLIEECETVADSDSSPTVTHIVRHDPVRVLADCAAKRRIITAMQTADDQAWQDGASGPVVEFITGRVLRLLAEPYAAHPGFRDEWRV